MIHAPDFRAGMIGDLATQQLRCFGSATGAADDMGERASGTSVLWILAQSLACQDLGFIAPARAVKHFGQHAARGSVCRVALNGRAEKARRFVKAAQRKAAFGCEQQRGWIFRVGLGRAFEGAQRFVKTEVRPKGVRPFELIAFHAWRRRRMAAAPRATAPSAPIAMVEGSGT